MAENKKDNKKRASSKGGSKAPAKRTENKARGARSSDQLPIEAREKRTRDGDSFLYQVAPFAVLLAAVLLGVFLIVGDGAGVVGGFICMVLLGLSGLPAYGLPVLLIISAVIFAANNERFSMRGRAISVAVFYILLSVLFHVCSDSVHGLGPIELWRSGVGRSGGGILGGLLGTVLLWAFKKYCLILVIPVMIFLAFYIFGVTPKSLWLSIRYNMLLARENAENRRLLRREDERVRAEERAENLRLKRAEKASRPESSGSEPQRFKVKKKKFATDVPIDSGSEAYDYDSEADAAAESVAEKPQPEPNSAEIDERIFDEAMRRTKARRAAEAAENTEPEKSDSPPETVASEDTDEPLFDMPGDTPSDASHSEVITAVNSEDGNSGEDDLKGLFVNPEDAELLDRLAEAYLGDNKGPAKLEVERQELGEVSTEAAESEPAEEPQEQPRMYCFPPISILTEDLEKRDVNVRQELHNNAVKLVETLRSFNVKTKIENVSRGPTITRYEILPEAGTRVRSIVNLADDIALNLATTGVRIEAPIPGKPAVGIEVPNKNRATVHLRTLLEDSDFTETQSKLLCALGEDVGGEPVYLDISKMPHLLIAGATGMGKSVCINSLIVSLLFNAKPDEVKLILIDPKKVELNIYNGIPHLLVPVVSDPKKAAGSLSWAVSEMERRFGLIESVGVRNITAYNKITENDPEYEFLPYIVIIIDELADLMMTAPDDVEESVCRLMQKARAAGMHVIIGTQRPSVDVITGLIKANIPSRIAFTVASQVDSRTIIDRSGAESLIGRGDMLYIPVGASKPIRVQGAFVSEADVEKVVTFIKENNSESKTTYADEVMEKIEKEAEKCGMGKKGSGAISEDGDDDPMLRSALELAVNSGKISTSLIQRRLSLGYGRAAKLIDRMEQLGYVSPPEGQKPRDVLITKDQFMEMVLRKDDNVM